MSSGIERLKLRSTLAKKSATSWARSVFLLFLTWVICFTVSPQAMSASALAALLGGLGPAPGTSGGTSFFTREATCPYLDCVVVFKSVKKAFFLSYSFETLLDAGTWKSTLASSLLSSLFF